MATSLQSVAPLYVDYNGGDQITLTGQFVTGVAYTARVGEQVVYSGIAGRGNLLYSLDGTTLTGYCPPLQSSEATYDVSVYASSAGMSFLAGALRAVPSFYLSEVFSLRSILPLNYLLGPRDFSALPPVVPK
jgi:hypothetical protein